MERDYIEQLMDGERAYIEQLMDGFNLKETDSLGDLLNSLKNKSRYVEEYWRSRPWLKEDQESNVLKQAANENADKISQSEV